MKLVKFQIGYPTAGSPGHSNSIAAGAVGIAGVEIGLAGTASGQNHCRSLKQINMAALLIENVGPFTTPIIHYQIHRNPVCEDFNIFGSNDPVR